MKLNGLTSEKLNATGTSLPEKAGKLFLTLLLGFPIPAAGYGYEQHYMSRTNVFERVFEDCLANSGFDPAEGAVVEPVTLDVNGKAVQGVAVEASNPQSNQTLTFVVERNTLQVPHFEIPAGQNGTSDFVNSHPACDGVVT